MLFGEFVIKLMSRGVASLPIEFHHWRWREKYVSTSSLVLVLEHTLSGEVGQPA